MEVGQILTLLVSRAKLDRDRGLKEFESALLSLSQSDIERTCAFILDNATKQNVAGTSWEGKHGSLSAAKIAIATSFQKLPADFSQQCEDACFGLMNDSEFRVRYLAAEVLGVLACKIGSSLYERRRDVILGFIRDLLSAQEGGDGDATEANNRRERRCSSPSPTRNYNDGCDGDLSPTARSASPNNECSSDNMRRMSSELTKWKALEVWVKCLLCIVEGLGGKAFEHFVDDSFLQVLFDTVAHKDRYVRETGFQIIGSLLDPPNSSQCASNNGNGHCDSNGCSSDFRAKVAPHLRLGLSDNWSHVRMAACVAARNLFESLPNDESERGSYYAVLLPALCLNRYHLAEGVRTYSQETWKIVTRGEGKALVESHLPAVVDFYVEQCEAKNHAVREASCSCIAELAIKMNKDLVRPHVPKLLNTLLVCFNDDSWPVRDGACQACGKIIASFPEESRPSVDKIVALMGENLRDSMSSVRAGAAVALGNVAKTYKGEFHAQIVDKYLFAGLLAVNEQPDEAHRFAHTVYPVKNDQVGDACNTHLRRFCRPAEPWEFTDGAICLFVEIANTLTPNEVSKGVELAVAATSRRNYSQHSALLSTMCKQLPELAKNLGKQAFKTHLESFFEPLFYCIDQQHLALVAGETCIVQLCQFIGPSVFRGRVQNYNPAYLRQLDRLLPPSY